MPDPVNPPAIVRQVETPSENPRIITLLAEAKGFGERSIKHFIAAGKALIRAKAICPHGQWLPSLAKAGISAKTAGKWMRVARNEAKLAPGANLNEAIDFLSQHAEPDTEPPQREIGDEDEENAILKLIVCKNCARKGPTRDCKDCESLRNRVKGDRKRKSKGGKLAWDWKKFNEHFAPVARAPEAIVKAWPDEKGQWEYGEAVKLLEKLAELMKEWRERLTGAKK